MAPLIENPEILRGKTIKSYQIGTKPFRALARAGIGWPTEARPLDELDAEAVANSANTPQELADKSSRRPNKAGVADVYYGISVETAEQIQKLLQKLASEDDR
jgi:hypothetical protein